MIRLLKFIFTGDWHLHIWEDIYSTRIEDDDGKNLYTRFYCKCKICGKHVRFN
jgi:hypothetical protein